MSMFVLKIIAATTMFIDHSAVAFAGYLPFDTYFLMRSVGRIAFPIFAFCIAEGCRHTRSMTGLLFRLLIFAVISEVAFDMLFAASWGWSASEFFVSYIRFDGFSIGLNNNFLRHQNIFFTLFLSVLAIHIYKSLHKDEKLINNTIVAAFAVLITGVFANIINADYGFNGVFVIFTCYLIAQKSLRIIPLIFLAFLLYDHVFLIAGALAAVIPVYLYNGKRGPAGEALKWTFYGFYPLHLLVLGMLGMMI